MKNTIVIGILLLNLNFMFGQTIDELNSNKKVAKFLEKEINKKYTFKEVFDKEVEADDEDFEYFVKKTDLDNNGFTDLVVNAYVPLIIVLNNGDKDFKELNFRNTKFFSDNEPELDSIAEIGNEKVLIFETEIQEFDDEEYPNIKIKKNQEALSYNSKTKESEWTIRDVKYKVDSLTVKFGELVEYKNIKPKVNRIKELYFSTTGCFGSCPIFDIKLDSERNLEYNGKKFTNHSGLKSFRLNQTDYDNVIGLIEYAELKKLKSFYSVNWTDDQTGILKVIYENGEVKEIQDYGLQGTINLKAIYKKLFEINKNVK
ncbi:DUF6438 domain-containing protein [Winogradskyella sediminis]|uniref:DUF6438 domain-containing protein n=1 Tax=Winogradskyella sediminis TaxID=1382466 RepID=UPI000E22B199|nr:DUF6438 domain-containing protein [Winogradskyella sediminis]REG86030.1 hypothetical protein C8N41_103126 [Winogradskyella sediminis]